MPTKLVKTKLNLKGLDFASHEIHYFIMRHSQSILLFVTCILLLGCSNTPRLSEPSAEDKAYMEVAKKEISLLEKEMEYATKNHYDVLGYNDFLTAVDNLEYARNLGFTASDEKEFRKVLQDAYKNLKDAKAVASSPRPEFRDILALRKEILDAGAKEQEAVKFSLIEADDLFRGLVDIDKTEKMERSKITVVKDAYKKVLVKVVQAKMLNDIKTSIDAVSQSGGKDRVPCTLAAAIYNVSVAERSIASNLNKPDRYSKDVERARNSAQALKVVMDTASKNAKTVPKDEAARCISNAKNQKPKE